MLIVFAGVNHASDNIGIVTRRNNTVTLNRIDIIILVLEITRLCQ